MDVVIPRGDGLFLVRSDNPKLWAPPPKAGYKIEVAHDGAVHEFRSGIQMDGTDLRVLLALVAIAGTGYDRFNSSSVSPPLRALWSAFEGEGLATSRDAVVIETTAYSLLATMGYKDTGANRRRLKEVSLVRLSMVKEFIRKGADLISGANLLTFKINELSGVLTVGLSPQVARAVLGESKQFSSINLEEVRKLTRPAAVILHAALSTRLRRGTIAKYHIDKLVKIAIGTDTENAATRRTRRRNMKPALDEIAALHNWAVAIDGNMVTIARPSN